MSQSPLEVGEIFRRYRPEFLEAYGDVMSFEQRQVIEALAACRTPMLGGHLYECDACTHPLVLYNSCLNRHCPLCHQTAAADWFDARKAELLPVGYFHVVFTLAHSLAPLALQNKRVVYGLLFRAASQTLLKIAADPSHLGAKIGFLTILHTWGQTLLHHPHLHCIVPGGGLSFDRSRWVSSRPDFFLPVRVLSRLFRGRFLALLEQAYREGELRFHGSLAHLTDKRRFHALINSIRKKEWVVYAKEPFGSPEQVLKYLARYTHRVAISNRRLISIDEGRVTFRWKDYAKGNRWRTTSLEAKEFIRRFLLHVLPKGFVRIRSYGFLANRGRTANLELCRHLLGVSSGRVDLPSQDMAPSMEEEIVPETDEPDGTRDFICPVCRKGRMIHIREIRPWMKLELPAAPSRRANTS